MLVLLIGLTNRRCIGSEDQMAKWDVPDFSDCVSQKYEDLFKEVGFHCLIFVSMFEALIFLLATTIFQVLGHVTCIYLSNSFRPFPKLCHENQVCQYFNIKYHLSVQNCRK